VAALVGMLAVKLVWAGGLPMSARWAVYDDALFVRQAYSIAQGEWLGSYTLGALMKSPMYPLFIALCHALHVPLSLAQHLLHAGACVLMLVALRPLIPSTAVLVLSFGLCLFDPLSFHTALLSGVIREGIYPALALLALVSAAAMLIRRDAPVRRLSAWATGFGVALGAFWLTREEGVWLLPSVALLVAVGIALTIRSRPRDAPARLAVWLLPFSIAGAMVLGVCALNRARYGVFAVNELKLPQFEAAYGALSRVGQGRFQQYVVLPRASRQLLYEQSPAFRELAPFFEGPQGERWELHGPRTKATQGEIYGGWFWYALRDAVESAGHGASAPEALAYYGRLAAEVNAACDQGRIPCGPPWVSLAPPWHPSYAAVLWRTVGEALQHLVTWRGFRAHIPFSGGTQGQYGLFQEMTRSALTPPLPEEVLPLRGRAQRTERDAPQLAHETPQDAGDSSGWSGVRVDLLEVLGPVFQRGVPLLVLVAAAAWGLAWWALFSGQRDVWPLLLVSSALVLAIGVRLVLLAYIDATSFPALNARYMAPLTPLLLLFCGVSLAGAAPAAAALRRR
jgi:hypothetical protein